MQARFIGDPRSDGHGPAVLKLWGHSFVKGEWTPVTDADVFRKLTVHNHFETKEGGKAAPPKVEAAEPAAETLHGGEAGGSMAAAEGKIPADWRKLHHSTRIKLAKELDSDLADTINTAADADQVIEWHEGKDNG